MTSRTSAGGVILGPEGKIALVEQHGNSWSFPKGGVEAGEDERAAAAREIAEETGLTQLEHLADLGSYARRSIGPGGVGENTQWPESTRVLFLFKTPETQLKPNDPDDEDITQARWVTLDEALTLLTHPKDKEFLASVRATIERWL